MNTQIKIFWYIFFISLIFVNENFVQWLLAIFVGKYSIIDGFKDAYEYFTITGYLFFSAFRAIPYIILLCVIKSGLKRRSPKHIGIAWGGLAGIIFMTVLGAWLAQHPYYTDAHVSSTTAVAFLFIPMYAVFTGLFGGLVGFFIAMGIITDED